MAVVTGVEEVLLLCVKPVNGATVSAGGPPGVERSAGSLVCASSTAAVVSAALAWAPNMAVRHNVPVAARPVERMRAPCATFLRLLISRLSLLRSLRGPRGPRGPLRLRLRGARA